MKLSDEVLRELKQGVSESQTVEDLLGKEGVIKNLVKGLLEEMLEAELTGQLGYAKHDKSQKKTDNRRNGSSSKTLKSQFGKIPIQVPRDRKGDFEPVLIRKYQKDLGVIEDKVISMYAKGMSTRDISAHIEEIYGIELSAALISQITDKVLEKAKEWQARPLESLYAIVYFDAIHFKVREDGKVISKAAYTAMGYDKNGYRDLLGIWIGESESAHFWCGVMAEMKNRGLQDILIACVDGLKGLPEAIEATFPQTEIQLCVIHQIRNSLRYIPYKHQKQFMTDLKAVYKAPTREAAESELAKMEKAWAPKYYPAVKPWGSNWHRLSVYFKYPEEIRKLIYTTNILEGVHRQLRKVTKTKTIFPHDDALRKILYLALVDLQKSWHQPRIDWAGFRNNFAIIFSERWDKLLS